MPNLFLKPCQYAGCREYAVKGSAYCREHQTKVSNEFDKQWFSLAGNGTRHDALLKNVRNVFMFYQYLSDYPKEYILDMFRDKASQLGLSSSEIETPLRDAMKFGLSNQKTLN